MTWKITIEASNAADLKEQLKVAELHVSMFPSLYKDTAYNIPIQITEKTEVERVK